MVDRNWTLEEFMEHRHAEVQLWPVFMRATEKMQSSTAEGRELLRQHFLYWWDLEEQGKLFGAGPMDSGTLDQMGFALLIASSRDEAESLAHDEPFHAAGWRVNTVHHWNLNEGSAVLLGQELTGTGKEYLAATPARD